MIKLYDINLPAKVYEPCTDGSTYITVDHMDGMYSYGKTEKGAIVNLSAVTPLHKHEDGYKIGTGL